MTERVYTAEDVLALACVIAELRQDRERLAVECERLRRALAGARDTVRAVPRRGEEEQP